MYKVYSPLITLMCLIISLASARAEVPMADDLAAQPKNYHKAAPNLATGGAPKQNELTSLKAAGVEYFIDLRTEAEGILSLIHI